MNAAAEKFVGAAESPIVREYNIGDTKYIVKATVKTGANEDAAAKVRRLIRNDVFRKSEK